MQEKLNNLFQSYQLRCYECFSEFKKDLKVTDSICELECPSCGKKSVELNLGKRVQNG